MSSEGPPITFIPNHRFRRKSRKGELHEKQTTDSTLYSLCGGRDRPAHIPPAYTGTKWRRTSTGAATPVLQPVPARYPAGRSASRDRKGPARSSFHRKRSDGTVASIAAADSDRSTANIGAHRTKSKRSTRQAHEFRREHISFQEQGLRLLP